MYYVFANADFFDYILYINNDSIFLWTVKHFPSFCTDVRYLDGTYVSYVLNVFTFDIYLLSECPHIYMQLVSSSLFVAHVCNNTEILYV